MDFPRTLTKKMLLGLPIVSRYVIAVAMLTVFLEFTLLREVLADAKSPFHSHSMSASCFNTSDELRIGGNPAESAVSKNARRIFVRHHSVRHISVVDQDRFLHIYDIHMHSIATAMMTDNSRSRLYVAEAVSISPSVANVWSIDVNDLSSILLARLDMRVTALSLDDRHGRLLLVGDYVDANTNPSPMIGSVGLDSRDVRTAIIGDKLSTTTSGAASEDGQVLYVGLSGRYEWQRVVHKFDSETLEQLPSSTTSLGQRSARRIIADDRRMRTLISLGDSIVAVGNEQPGPSKSSSQAAFGPPHLPVRDFTLAMNSQLLYSVGHQEDSEINAIGLEQGNVLCQSMLPPDVYGVTANEDSGGVIVTARDAGTVSELTGWHGER